MGNMGHLPCLQYRSYVYTLVSNKSYHVFLSVKGPRYGRIIREEKIYDIMQKLYDEQNLSDYPDPLMLQLLKSILHLLRPFFPGRRRSSVFFS